MSPEFLFVLGRETELCAAELETVLSVVDPAASIQKLPTGLALVQPSAAFDPQWWVGRLGGTRLIATVVGSVQELTAAALEPFVPATVRELALSSAAVSARQRMKLLLQLKNLRPGIRYRPTDDAYLASGLSERLLRRDDGLELLIVEDPTLKVGSRLLVAQVVAVQDTRAWTERDRGLPSPDPVAGMLPPKLARIMVNLAEPARSNLPTPGAGRLLDPFCGSGQIPIDALRLGWTVQASDLELSAIERTTRNLEWARQRYELSQTPPILQSDVVELPKKLVGQTFDAIVTEPDLGPPLRSSTTLPSEKILDGVAATISHAFEVGRTLLRSGGRMVIVTPIIAGNRIADRLDEEAFSGYRHPATFHYARPDSRVEREIFVLDRN